MKVKEEIKVTIEKGTVIPIKEGGKYLLILPKDANIKEISKAIAKFFAPTPVFVLAVNEVTDIKIAQLLSGEVGNSEVSS